MSRRRRPSSSSLLLATTVDLREGFEESGPLAGAGIGAFAPLDDIPFGRFGALTERFGFAVGLFPGAGLVGDRTKFAARSLSVTYDLLFLGCKKAVFVLEPRKTAFSFFDARDGFAQPVALCARDDKAFVFRRVEPRCRYLPDVLREAPEVRFEALDARPADGVGGESPLEGLERRLRLGPCGLVDATSFGEAADRLFAFLKPGALLLPCGFPGRHRFLELVPKSVRRVCQFPSARRTAIVAVPFRRMVKRFWSWLGEPRIELGPFCLQSAFRGGDLVELGLEGRKARAELAVRGARSGGSA